MSCFRNTFFFIVIIMAMDSLNAGHLQAQNKADISRIEFNSGTRTYREQIVLTRDSVRIVKEDFRVDQRPNITDQTMSPREWNALIRSLDDVRLSEIENLQSPTMKRTYDAAAHGSLIITTANGDSYAHGFDDENPHKKFKPLMEQIRRFRKK